MNERVDRSVARARQLDFAALDRKPRDHALDRSSGAVLRAMVDERERPRRCGVFAIERRPDLGSRQLLAGRVGDLLDHLAELDLQKTRQRQPVVALEQVRDAALAGLAVHANHGIIGAADVGRDRSEDTARPIRRCRARARARGRRDLS